jgi:hypothetical protein
MRTLGLLLVLIITTACGENGSKQEKRTTDSGTGTGRTEWDSSWDTQGTGNCRLSDGSEVRCESLRGADGLGVDLLDTMVDVRVDITSSEIIFGESKVSTRQGRRIDCKTEVQSGESYAYGLSGNTLNIRKPDGTSISLQRLNETVAGGLIGAWAWRGYTSDGVHIIRQLTIVNNSRAILQTHCEL